MSTTATTVRSDSAVSMISGDGHHDSSVTIPDAHFLFHADFKRTGSDLTLTGDDGHRVVVPGYFQHEHLPTLLSPEGAALTGDIVEALAGSVAPGQYAQATAPAAGAPAIGKVATVQGGATAVRNGVTVTLNVGDAVLKGDVIQTSGSSAVGVIFTDGATFNLDANARMVLNEFVYDPNGSSNSAAITLVQGTINFLAGQVAKSGDMKVGTPVATMGIRGTAVGVTIQADSGAMQVSVFAEADQVLHTIQVWARNIDGTQGPLLGTVTSNSGIFVFNPTPTGLLVQELAKDAATIQSEQNKVAQVFQTQSIGLQFLQAPDNTKTAQNAKAPAPIVAGQIILSHSDSPTQIGGTGPTVVKFNPDGSPDLQQELGPTNGLLHHAPVAGNSVNTVVEAGVTTTNVPFAGTPAAGGNVLDNFVNVDAGVGDILSVKDGHLISAHSYGNFVLRSDGSYEYTLNNDDPLVQALAFGETATEVWSYTVTNLEGMTAQATLTITIVGTDDAPAVPIIVFGAVTEDNNVNAGDLATSGAITFHDVDLSDSHTIKNLTNGSLAPASVAVTDGHGNGQSLPGFDVAAEYLGRLRVTLTEDPSDNSDLITLDWYFTVDNSDPRVQALAAGQVVTQTYQITIDDGRGGTVTHGITVTITGVNDGPTIVAASTTPTGGVIEDTAVNSGGNVTTAGTIAFQDLDLIDTHTASFVLKSSDANANLPGFVGGTGGNVTHIGTFAIDNSVTESNNDTVNTGTLGWSFTLPDNDPVLQSLAAGQSITQVYTVTITDNNGATVTQDITVTINGTNDGPNDAPTIVPGSTTATGGVIEDTAVNSSGNVTTAGTIAFQDLDLIDTHTASFVLKSSDAAANLPGFAEGTGQNVAHIGTFAIDSAVTEDNTDQINTGTLGWSFTLSDTDPVLQSLAAGQTITQVYTVTIKDNNNAPVTQDVTVTITGTDDVPTIVAGSTTAAGGVIEDTAINSSGNVTTAGTIAFQDLDLIDTHAASFVLKSSDAAANLPGFTEGTGPNVAQIGTFAIDSNVTENNGDQINTGTLGWSFTLSDTDPVLQSLAAGQTITQVYTVTVKDNNNATVTQDVTVTITGVNDAPTIVGGSPSPTGTGIVIEDTAVNAGGNVTSAGTLTFRDLDLIDTHSASFVLKSSNAANLPGFTGGTGPSVAHIGTFAIDGVIENNGDTVNTGTLGWSFTLSDTDPVLQSLAAGQTITQIYTVTLKDSNNATVTRDVTVAMIGTNDGPTLVAGSTTATGGVIGDTAVDGGGNVTTAGTIMFQDLDLIDTHTASFVLKSSDAVADLPGFAEGTGPNVAHIGTFAIGSVAENRGDTVNTGTLGWSFTLSDTDPVLQSLAADQTITQVYTVTVKDNNNATVTQDVTVTIRGSNAGNDTITGDGNSNTLEGGLGNDVLDGGAGIDTASYEHATSGVTVSLALQGTSQNTIGAGFDTLTNFEALRGSAFDDTLTGNGNSTLEGGPGNDHLIGQAAGSDTASYQHATAGVTVDLSNAAAQNTGGAGTDTLTNIKNLTGSSFSDHLTGDANNNILSGGLGGTDVLTGGAGADTFQFGGGSVTVTDFSTIQGDKIELFNLQAATHGDAVTAINALISATTGDTFSFSDGSKLTLTNVDVHSLHASDFILHP